MKSMEYPRILVVSNNSFSLSNPNGRSLGNMFIGWPKECLAELCISTDGANFDLCDNYYCISDKDILTAFMQLRKAKGRKLVQNETGYININTGIKGQGKTATKAFVRHILWSCNRWKSKELVEWIDDFNPDAVLLQNGDSAFMLHMARKISCDRKKPLLLFNTEGNCLFEQDWMRRDKLSWLSFPIYKYLLRRETSKLMQRTKFIIHGNQLLKEDYDRAYGVPSEVVYTGSDVNWSEKPFNSSLPQIVYTGNFGFNRPASLAIVAKTLLSINSKFTLNVYGRPASKQQEQVLTHSDGIVFHGEVPYSKVKEIIAHADVLIHAEGMDEYFQEALRYGFSTKIADSLSSGRPFLLFSRPEIACADYIKTTGAGWFASNENELKEMFNLLIYNEEDRVSRLLKAKKIAQQNHNVEACRLKFQQLILQVIQ